MEEVYKEEDFYKDGGWPAESFRYCCYKFYTGKNTEYGPDYDQFALVDNAEYPYIRLTKKRGKTQTPCGGCSQPSVDGRFARLSDSEREDQCPKIAWGFAAVFVARLYFDDTHKDYVEKNNRNDLIKEYYNKYFKIYLSCHNGLKYSKVPMERKELDFLEEHEIIIRGLWAKCIPLKKYSLLFEYAIDAESDYENYLHARKNELQKIISGNGGLETEGSRTVIQNGGTSVYIENNTGPVVINSK